MGHTGRMPGDRGCVIMGENRCICCGEVIPEGLQVCPACVRKSGQKKPEKRHFDAMALLIGFCAVVGVAVTAGILAFAVDFVARWLGVGVK